MRPSFMTFVAVALGAVFGCDRGPGPEACYDVCGPGTACRDRRCVVAEATESPPTEEAPAAKQRRTRRKGKGRHRARAEASETRDFRPVDDSHIPKYDPNRVQHIDMSSGTERLPDAKIRAQLRRLEPKFNACIETAAMHSDEEIRPGSVDFVFSIEKTGKVSGVTVEAPPHLRVFGIVPCLRKALASHRFPSYDGPPTGVDYSFGVG
jgi:hypothetical protein